MKFYFHEAQEWAMLTDTLSVRKLAALKGGVAGEEGLTGKENFLG